jgi:nucleotide-binding universal stress UspA family protein
MSKTVLLAVDALQPAPQSMAVARELCHATGDKVIVLHVHEFAVGRFGRLQVDCPEGQAERVVPEIVAALREAGVTAEAEIRETHVGHVARAVVDAAEQHDARFLVLGSSGRTDLPHIPLGSVSHRLLHMSRRPVMLVPRQAAGQDADPAGQSVPQAVSG